ncbi:MAG: chemotaxis protein CheW [Desulfobacterales bacterium]|nr:chemotaxis protein CheW [Desulfobacterales bacterium]
MVSKNSAPQQPAIDGCWKKIGVWGQTPERCPLLEQFVHCRNCPTYAAAGRRFLERPQPPGYQEEWTIRLADTKEQERKDIKTAFVFRAGDEWLALSAPLIQEVVDMGIIHTLPHVSTSTLRGIVNIRGKLEICVSIGGVLGIERLEREKRPSSYVAPERLVVARHNDHIISFPVSEVMGNVRYRPEMLRDLPITVSGSKAVYTRKILCLPDKDVGFLKDEPLFKMLTKDLK